MKILNEFFFFLIDTSSSIQSIYSSILTTDHLMYSPTGSDAPNYHYEVIQITVIADGYYQFKTSDDIDTYSYLYEDYFSPANPSKNLISKDDKQCFGHELEFIIELKIYKKYVLIVTTSSSNVIGQFVILTIGPDKIIFSRISKNVYQTVQNIAQI